MIKHVLGIFLLVSTVALASQLRVSILIPGKIDDGGFMESGYQATKKIEAELGASIKMITDVPFDDQAFIDALTELANGSPDLVISHGGQTQDALLEVATNFPEIKFAITQGSVAASNVACFIIEQPQSNFLAGVLAALVTKSNIVGHISGIRVPPGLLGRAAYVDGFEHATSSGKLLTTFSGNQDQYALNYFVANAEIENGADVIFTMLNAGITGATDACRDGGILQIGNIKDWVAEDPDVFLGSAFADIGTGVFQAAKQVYEGKFEGKVTSIGLEDPNTVRLIVNEKYVSDDIKTTVESYKSKILSGEIVPKTEYTGPEFDPWGV